MQGASRRPQSSVGKRRNAADAPSCATLREGLAWPHGGVGRHLLGATQRRSSRLALRPGKLLRSRRPIENTP
jgi:hypothetical protein